MAGGGGAWKVAYADFVTAMMAFFLVMWIVAQNKPAVKEAIAGYFRDPSGKSSKAGKSTGTMPNKDSGPAITAKGPVKTAGGKEKEAVVLDEDADPSRAARKQSMLGIHDGSRLTVEAMVPFDDQSAELSDRGKKILDKLAVELLGKLTLVEIRGHSSSKPLPGDSEYKNAWELCYARSVATMNYLAEKGVEQRRIRLSQSGANEPDNIGEVADASLAQNSRVEVFILSELASPPTDIRKERPVKSKKADNKRPARPKTSEATANE